MSYFSKIKRFFKQILGRLPQKLPTGVPAFQEFIDDLIATYDMPTPDRESIVFCVGTTIMHLGNLEHKKSKYFFYRVLHTAAAKQVGAYCFTQVKENHAALERAKQSKPAEATAPLRAVPSDVEPA